MFNFAAYTPLESFLLSKSLLELGVTPTAFDRISALLLHDDLVRQNDSYDASRLSPGSLQELFLHLLRDELKLDRDIPDKAVDSPAKRRKLQAPSPATLQDACSHLLKVPALAQRLYTEYRAHQVRLIREDEDRIESLEGEIAQHENGLPKATPVPGPLPSSSSPVPVCPAAAPAPPPPQPVQKLDRATSSSTPPPAPAPPAVTVPPVGQPSNVPLTQPSPAVRPSPVFEPIPRPSSTGPSLAVPARLSTATPPTPPAPQPTLPPPREASPATAPAVVSAPPSITPTTVSRPVPSPHILPAPAPQHAKPAPRRLSPAVPHQPIAPQPAPVTGSVPPTASPLTRTGVAPPPQFGQPGPTVRGHEPVRAPNGAMASPVLQHPQGISVPSPRPPHHPQPLPQQNRILQRPEAVAKSDGPLPSRATPTPPAGTPLKWEPPYQPQQPFTPLQRPQGAHPQQGRPMPQPAWNSPVMPQPPAHPHPQAHAHGQPVSLPAQTQAVQAHALPQGMVQGQAQGHAQPPFAYHPPPQAQPVRNVKGQQPGRASPQPPSPAFPQQAPVMVPPQYSGQPPHQVDARKQHPATLSHPPQRPLIAQGTPSVTGQAGVPFAAAKPPPSNQPVSSTGPDHRPPPAVSPVPTPTAIRPPPAQGHGQPHLAPHVQHQSVQHQPPRLSPKPPQQPYPIQPAPLQPPHITQQHPQPPQPYPVPTPNHFTQQPPHHQQPSNVQPTRPPRPPQTVPRTTTSAPPGPPLIPALAAAQASGPPPYQPKYDGNHQPPVTTSEVPRYLASTPKAGPTGSRFTPALPQTPANAHDPGYFAPRGSATRWKSAVSTPLTPRPEEAFNMPAPGLEPLSPVAAPVSLSKKTPTVDKSFEATVTPAQGSITKATAKNDSTRRTDLTIPTTIPTTISKARGRPPRNKVRDVTTSPSLIAELRRRQSSPDELQADTDPGPARVKHEAETPRTREETGDTTADDESGPSRRQPAASHAVASLRGKRKRVEYPADDRTATPTVVPQTEAPSHVLWTRDFPKISASALEQIVSHRHANMFAHQIRDRDAPGYKTIVLGPMDLKSIRAAITHGNKSAKQAAASLVDGDPGSSTVWLPISEDLVPPRGIINSAQLDRELVHMFANAIMYNPDPHRGPGPTFLEPDVDEPTEEDAEAAAAGGMVLGYKVDENAVVNDTRSMFVEVEKLLSNMRAAERQRGAPPPPPGSKGLSASAPVTASSAAVIDDVTNGDATTDGAGTREEREDTAATEGDGDGGASGTGTTKRRRITRG